MGAAIRAHEWAETPLGRPAVWSTPLKALVGVLLDAKQLIDLPPDRRTRWVSRSYAARPVRA